MDKQILVCPYNGTLPSDEKEWTTDTSKNMDESQTNYADSKKPNKKEDIRYDSTNIKLLKIANSAMLGIGGM